MISVYFWLTHKILGGRLKLNIRIHRILAFHECICIIVFLDNNSIKNWHVSCQCRNLVVTIFGAKNILIYEKWTNDNSPYYILGDNTTSQIPQLHFLQKNPLEIIYFYIKYFYNLQMNFIYRFFLKPLFHISLLKKIQGYGLWNLRDYRCCSLSYMFYTDLQQINFFVLNLG